MRRNLTVLLLGLLLVAPATSGCTVTDGPSFDDEFQAWVGTWVGANARLQINLRIRRGAPFRSCIATYGENSDLYVTATLSDANTGYSATGTSTYKTIDLSGYAPEIELMLVSREVTDSLGTGHVTYSYRGALQGSQQVTGSVVVRRLAANDCCTPIPTETSAAAILRRQ